MSFLIIYIIIFIALTILLFPRIRNVRSIPILNGLRKLRNRKTGLTPLNGKKKDNKKQESAELFAVIEKKIIDEKIYLDPSVKLGRIARSLHVPEKKVSKAINEIGGDNFNSFINRFRVEEAKQLMLDPRNRNYTIDAMAELAGFSNKVSFYKSFRKITKKSPREFRKESISG